MNILLGTVLYKNELDLLLHLIKMMGRQTIWTSLPNLRFKWVIQDNDQGAQLETVEKLVNQLEADGLLPQGFVSNLKFVASENIGFARGQNQIFFDAEAALKAETGQPYDYFLCLNPDGVPHRAMLERLVSFAEQNHRKGLYEVRQFPVEHTKEYEPATGVTAWASGCCLLVPSEVFNVLQGFDPMFFLYMEDVDLSWRARSAGYQCYTVQDSLFKHYKENVRDVTQERKYMITSAYWLGSKFRNTEFKDYSYLKLTEIMDEAELASLVRHIEEKLPEYDSYKTEPFMIFSNGFYFSPVRWHRW